MSELQNEAADLPEVTEQIESSAEVEHQPSDLATDSEAQHEEQAQDTVDDDAKQASINAAINKKHWEMKEAERKAEAAQNELAEYKRKEQEQLAKSFEQMPSLPDPFDDDYDVKLQEYQRKLTEKANFDAQQNILNQQQQQYQQQQAMEQQLKLQEAANKYEERAIKDFGLTKEQVHNDAQILNQMGISSDLGMHIMADNEGALIGNYLANNAEESAQLFSQSPFQQASYIETVIKPKLKALKPKPTAAPKPPTNLNGNGADKNLGKFKHLSGAKFE